MRAALAAATPWAAPVATMAVVSISLSFSFPLFALLMERMGVSGAMVGLNHMIAALAMVIAAPVLPRIMARLGAVPVCLISIGALAAAMMAVPLFESYWWWAALRLVFGFTATALFYVSEYWLVAQAPDAIRGRIVAVYAVVLSGSYMVGPVLLASLGADGWLTYLVPTALILAGAVPVLISRHHVPAKDGVETQPPAAMLRFFWTDPLVMWGVVLFGTIEFGAMGLMTNWGMRSGFDETTSVQLVFWLAFGSLAMQFPIGWLAERVDRRYLMAIAGVLAVGMPLVIALGSGALWLIYAAIFVWGGAAVGLYTLALIELGARYRGTLLSEANAAVVLGYGLGALLAPSLLGWSMDLVPPDGVLWMSAVLAVAYVSLAAARLMLRPR